VVKGVKPVRLVAVQQSNGLIYVSSERALEADSGLPPPVGVPKSDVFKFDPDQYQRLRSKWERSGHTKDNDWEKLEAAN
jgi:hypothetical protein